MQMKPGITEHNHVEKAYPLIIRQYSASDWPSICRVHDRSRPFEIGGFVPPSAIVPMDRAAHDEGFFESQTFVACIGKADGELVAFISIKPPELTWCYVDPAWHRRGIGRKLAEHVLPLLGSDAFVLSIDQNPAALAFYQSLGFIITARFPGDAHGYPCQCVRLTFPTSMHRLRPPIPSTTALFLAGFTALNPGHAHLDSNGVFDWR
jgi:ribosomal protein S18 acetylase RimI-like enzyme